MPSRTRRSWALRVTLPSGDVAAGDDAHAGDLVDLTHLDAAQLHLLELGSQHTLHGGLDLLDGTRR